MSSKRVARERRLRRRIPCALTIAGKRYAGLALDLSSTGLYVQTNAKAAARSEVTVELSLPEATEPIELQGTVARRNTVPPQLLASAKGGLGVRVSQASEAYYELLRELYSSESHRIGTPRDAAEEFDRTFRERSREAAGRSFRVRVRQLSGSRSRSVLVTCEDEEAARAEALAEVGEGWKVLEVEPL